MYSADAPKAAAITAVARTATASGLSAGVKEMRVFVTDSRRRMQETGRVHVVQSTVQLPLDSMSFTSVLGNP